MSDFQELFQGDMARYKKSEQKGWVYKFLYYFRKVSTCDHKLLNYYYRFRFHALSQKHGIEIPKETVIGKGLYLGHAYNISVNRDARLGNNINLHKGVTIGRENRGARKGAPTIGNQVWIGVNATVVGNVTIGDDVLIAPNSFVNCDVPSHSIVIGCPCRIIPKELATEGYINNMV